jgi:hypothetical protein
LKQEPVSLSASVSEPALACASKPAAAAASTAGLALRLCKSILLAGAALYLLTYLVCAFGRVAFPWDIEWMEGGMIVHAARVLRGEPIYAAPSAKFIAFFYPPVYPWLLALLSPLTGGLSFALGRSVSVVASLCTMGMLFYVARREAGQLAGWMAVGLYAALFRTAGAFYDLARADSLALAIALAAALVAFYVPTRRGAGLSAALFALAFYTKQTGALIALAVGIYLLTVSLERALAFGVVCAVLGLGVGLALDWSSVGWFRFYTLEGHQGHRFLWKNFRLQYWRDLLFLSPFVVLIPALGASYGRISRWLVAPFMGLLITAFVQRVQTLDYEPHMYYRELWYENPRPWLVVPPLLLTALLVLARVLQREARAPHRFFLLLAVAGGLASALNHSTQWAYANCFMPVALFGSLLAAIVVGQLWSAAESSRRGQLGLGALTIALMIQYVALLYDPRKQIPNADDRAAVLEFERVLARYPGPVLVPSHPLYSYLRDGTVHLHQMSVGDVAFDGGVRDLKERLKRGEYPTVVLDTDVDVLEGMEDYDNVYTFRYKGDALNAKTGLLVRPRGVWVHR